MARGRELLPGQSGIKNKPLIVPTALVQTQGRGEARWGHASLSARDGDHAASAALHSSDMVALQPPSLPVLNWPFLIFPANSMPLMVAAAFSNRLNPSIGRIRCLTRR